MAMNFPKGQRAIAFDRATAFPLDANAYFESLVSAEAAVKSAEEVGSKLTAYYFGQQIAVVENDVATLYIIEKATVETSVDARGYEGQLKEVGSKTLGDEASITLDENGVLSIYGFADAGNKCVPYKDTATGKIVWGTVEGLIPDAVVPVGDGETILVQADEHDSTKRIISLLGKDGAADKAILRKHINGGVASYTWDVIYDKAELDALLANKVDKVEGKSLVSDTEITKLAGIEAGAQANVIEEIKVNGVKVEPTAKAVNIDVAGEVGKLDIEASKVKVAADKTLATKLTEVDSAIAAKQDALTAGKGIIIQENTIKLDESIILGGGGAADWKE